MKEFNELLEVASVLNGPNGCPWDLKQNFFSLQPYVIEEAYELVEAVDGQNDQEIIEELGDLLYTVIFYAKIAQKEERFSIKEILETIKNKLVRRHPHVFTSLKEESIEEISKNWDRIKKEEGKQKKSSLEGIPDQMPLLAKAQKMLKVFFRAGFIKPENVSKLSEEEMNQQLFDLIQRAEQSGIDIEGAFRRFISEKRKNFQAWEGKKD